MGGEDDWEVDGRSEGAVGEGTGGWEAGYAAAMAQKGQSRCLEGGRGIAAGRFFVGSLRGLSLYWKTHGQLIGVVVGIESEEEKFRNGAGAR